LVSSYTPEPEKLKSFAGMYRNLLNNTTIELRAQAGKLSLGQGELIALTAGEFVGSAGQHLYLADGRLRLVTPDDETTYERVEAAHPTPSDLAALFGQYESSETGTTLTIAAGEKPEQLSLRVGSDPAVALRPTFRDAFA